MGSDPRRILVAIDISMKISSFLMRCVYTLLSFGWLN